MLKTSRRHSASAVEKDGLGCEALYIVNDEAFTDEPIETCIAEPIGMPGHSTIGVRGHEADISNAKAKRLLGWKPRHSWHEYDRKWERAAGSSQ